MIFFLRFIILKSIKLLILASKKAANMFHKKKQNSGQIFRPRRPSSSYSVLPTLNQVMFQLKKQTPVFALQSQLVHNQIHKKEEQLNFLLSPKSATNLHNEISFQNKSSLVDRILFANMDEGKQEKHQIKKQQKNSPKKQSRFSQLSSKLLGETILLNEKQKHQRIQSAEKIPQISYLRSDHRRMQELNRYLKRQLETIKYKLTVYEEQLHQQAIIIQQKQEIIRKMSSFNDELCLKLIDFQAQKSIQNQKKNSQSFQQLGTQILALKQNDKPFSPKTNVIRLLSYGGFSQQKLKNQINKCQGQNQKINKIRPFHQQKGQNIKNRQIKAMSQQTQHSNQLPIEQISRLKKFKKHNLSDMTLMLKQSMNQFWQVCKDDDKQKLYEI